MNTSTRLMAATVAAMSALVSVGAGPAGAESDGTTVVPLLMNLRSCDFTKLNFARPSGYGSGQAVIGTNGSNTVTATVQLGSGKPNTPYSVRLIQLPRAGSAPCNAGDPGVASAVLTTDSNGTGAVSVQGPVQSGANGAWVFVEGPPAPGKLRGEYYTSEVIAPLS